jgi:hypothetical protein
MIAEEIALPRTGRPPHEPTPETRQQVETLSGYGTSHQHIAEFIGLARETLEKHYGRELRMGALKANAKVGAAQFARATDVNHPQGVTAAIWWEKTRCGMREPKQDVALSGALGVYDATKLASLSDEELKLFESVLARIAPGAAASVGGEGGDSEAG